MITEMHTQYYYSLLTHLHHVQYYKLLDLLLKLPYSYQVTKHRNTVHVKQIRCQTNSGAQLEDYETCGLDDSRTKLVQNVCWIIWSNNGSKYDFLKVTVSKFSSQRLH